jgi:hypothetical protein
MPFPTNWLQKSGTDFSVIPNLKSGCQSGRRIKATGQGRTGDRNSLRSCFFDTELVKLLPANWRYGDSRQLRALLAILVAHSSAAVALGWGSLYGTTDDPTLRQKPA